MNSGAFSGVETARLTLFACQLFVLGLRLNGESEGITWLYDGLPVTVLIYAA
jgi:hypothetical protein